MNRFLAILRFLTRIPVKVNTGFDEEFHKGMYFFPAVGTIIGIIIYVAMAFTYSIFNGDAFIAALVAVMAETAITGGLHIDGLGDTFDALFSYRNRERMLEIMKDSRLGTNAMLAVLFTVLLKIGVISILIDCNLYALVVLMPVVSRFLVLMLAYKSESPREYGMGNAFIGKCSIKMIISGALYTIVVSSMVFAFFYGFESVYMISYVLIGVFVSAVFMYVFRKWVYSKIGGITGDILGCGIELSEIVFIIFVYIAYIF